MKVVVTTGATRCAKPQSNRHQQQTNTRLFTGRMPFLSSNHRCQSIEGKIITTHMKLYNSIRHKLVPFVRFSARRRNWRACYLSYAKSIHPSVPLSGYHTLVLCIENPFIFHNSVSFQNAVLFQKNAFQFQKVVGYHRFSVFVFENAICIWDCSLHLQMRFENLKSVECLLFCTNL